MSYDVTNLLVESFKEKVSEESARDVGKILQFANEIFIRKWIKDFCGIDNDKVENDEFGNEPSWDINMYPSSKRSRIVRVQAKFRGGKSKSGMPTLHMENTRRVSKKNLGDASSSGHVAYSKDEFDVVVFTIPREDIFTTEHWEVLAIPTYELIDPKYPNYLCRRVSSALYKKYKGKAKEVLTSL